MACLGTGIKAKEECDSSERATEDQVSDGLRKIKTASSNKNDRGGQHPGRQTLAGIGHGRPGKNQYGNGDSRRN
jgi:hypothetical protein